MSDDNPVLSARKSLGLTQTAMARELGVNISTIVRWEKGHLDISPLAKLAVERLVERARTAA